MSASAVRGGQVYVEIGANPSKLLNALRVVNTQIGNLGSSMVGVGMRMTIAGGAMTAPIIAAGVAFAAQNEQVERARKSLSAVGNAIGNAVAPAVVGLSRIIADVADHMTVFVSNNKNVVRIVLAAGLALTAGGTALSLFGRYLIDASRAASLIAKPIGLAADSLLSFANAASRASGTIASGVLFAVVATSKLSASVATVSFRVASSAVRAFQSLWPLVESVGVAFIDFGVAAVSSAQRMVVAFAVANPYLAVMAGMAATIVVVMASLSVSSSRAGGEVKNAAAAVGSLGDSSQTAFQKIISSLSASSIGSAISNAIDEGVSNGKVLFSDLYATADSTVTGIYNAISAGDLAGAVDILLSGAVAAWSRGEQAVMGLLDPWIESVQNVFTDMGASLASIWDDAWTQLATSDWGGYLLGAFDNYINTIMATWDQLIGYLQKAWARYSAWFSGDVKAMEAEIARVDAANAGNASQRGRDRPGFAGRTGLSDEEKARMRQESADRRAAMAADAEQTKKDRAARTASNVTDRAKAVQEANAALQQKVAKTSEPPPVTGPGAKTVGTAVAGTFSAFGVDQMAGAGNVQKQQLDALLKIQAGVEEANRVGLVVA